MTLPSKIDPFPSFDAMRASHSKLLKQFSLDAISDETSFMDSALEFLGRGQVTGALLDSEADRDGAQTMLDYWSSRLYRIQQSSTEVILDDFDEELAPEIPDELCPYRGLSAFREKDSGIFFGRQKVLDEMVSRLKESRLLAVIGPSGSGKSSVVRAGLLPMLRDGAVQGGEDWTYLPIFMPGSVPLKNLLVAITRAEVGETDNGVAENPDDHDHSEETAELVNDPEYLQNLLEDHFGKSVVIVIDQFEEIFTLCDSESVRKAFVENILAISSAPDSNHHIIITMRVDFETKLAVYPELQKEVEANTVRLTPLTAADLREAIEEPARQIGLKFEEGLIDNLLNDILGEPAALPLLQFTLLKLWENRDHNRITWEDYRKLGGGRQALANSADKLYNSLIPEDQITARRILLRLVRPGEGMEVTSQRMRRVDLYSRSDAVDRIDRVLEKFIDAQLLRLTRGRTEFDDQIEVAHEALVRNWPTLVGWLEDEREAIRQRRRLTTAAERWYEFGCSEDLLLRGVELEEAIRHDDLNESETNFIKASQQARADEIEKAQQVADELRRRNRIITTASIVAGVVAVIAIVLGLVAVNRQNAAATALKTATQALGEVQIANIEVIAQANTAEAERQRADEQRLTAEAAEAQALQEKSTAQAANTQIVAQQITERALSTAKAVQETAAAQAQRTAAANSMDALTSQLADQARSLVSRQTDLGVLLGIEAAKIRSDLVGKGVLMDVMRANPHLNRYLQAHQGAVNVVDYRPDGRVLASAGTDLNVYLWSLQVDEEPTVLASGGEIAVNALDFSSSNTVLAAGTCAGLDRGGTCSGGLLQMWELTSGNFGKTTMEIHRDAVTAVQFDPSGSLIATGAEDGIVQVWNMPETIGIGLTISPSALYTFTGQVGAIRSMVFTPNRRYLITASDDGTVYVRDLPQASVVVSFIDHKASVRAVAVSPDGRYLATGGEDANIFIYDLTRFIRIGNPLSQHTSAVTGLDFSPDGTSLISASEDGTIIQWDLPELYKSGEFGDVISTQTLLGHKDAVLSVQYSPDGSRLASGGRGSAVIEWIVKEPYPLATGFVPSDETVTGLGFSQQGDQLLVTRTDNTLTNWDLATGLSSNGAQWTQVGSTLRIPSTVGSVFIEPGTSDSEDGAGTAFGLRQNVVTSEEVLGVDASRFNGSVDWDAVREDGYTFAFIKATQGEGFVDESFKDNWARLQEAGIIRGAYHFFSASDDPIKQAEFFAEIVAWEPGDLPPVVDVEDDYGLSGSEVLANLKIFLARLEELAQRKPVIYTNPSFWMRLASNQGVGQVVVPAVGGGEEVFNASDYPLWVANYSTADQPLLPAGWNTWTFWQYTDDGEVDGFIGTVFLSRFNGNLQALESLAKNEPVVAIDPGAESTSLINLNSKEQIGELLPLLNPSSAALYFDGKLLAVGSKNGSITFWDLEQGYQTELVLTAGSSSVDSLAFNPDGHYLAAGNADGNIKIWDLESGDPNPVQELSSHTSRVISLSFGGSGQVMASGSADGSVILWDINQFKSVGQPLQGPNSSVVAVAIDVDARVLAAGYANGTVLLWDIQPESWQKKACIRAGRNLTPAEWNSYLPGINYRETCP